MNQSSKKPALRMGIGGPVGAGKTAMVKQLCMALRQRVNLAVITNDIYTREDADFLLRHQALSPDRIKGVETGGCPHTAIREDASMNLLAVDELNAGNSAFSSSTASRFMLASSRIAVWGQPPVSTPLIRSGDNA